MLTASSNPLNQWPKVRRVKPGMLRVKGWCISPGQWLVMRGIAFVIVTVLISSVLAAAAMPWLVGIFARWGQGNPVSIWIFMLMDLRWWLRQVFTEDFPALGEAIWYTGTNPFDWHLLSIGIVMIWTRRFLRYGIAASLGLIISPIFGSKFKVSFTRDTVIIHRWLRSLKLYRHASTGGEVSFRSTGPEYQTGLWRLLMRLELMRPSQENEFAQVMVITGLRPIRLVTSRTQLVAEKIVQSMQLAMQHSRNLMEKQ
jgi:hypothetical protein